MPKANPVSLHPLNFDEAIKTLIHIAPNPKKEKVNRGRRRSAKTAKDTKRKARTN
jgi:hypothetical protein